MLGLRVDGEQEQVEWHGADPGGGRPGMSDGDLWGDEVAAALERGCRSMNALRPARLVGAPSSGGV